MKKQLIYITLFLIQALFFSCEKNNEVLNDGVSYMQLNTRTGGDGSSDNPCFIFWKMSDFNASGFNDDPTDPLVYSLPGGMIDDYNVSKIKYNTREIYPSLPEWVYAVGVSPASIPGADPQDWKTFDIDPEIAGLIDIQCAPVISGNEQDHFSEPLRFTHQLTKLQFKGYCGESMWESDTKHINVKKVTITLRSDMGADQWELFPEKLTWAHGSIGVGQYRVSSYSTDPAESLKANLPILGEIPGNTTYAGALSIGSLYLVPGFKDIVIELKATYEDTTDDEKTTIVREWTEFLIKNIGEDTHSNETKAGYSYAIYIGFEKRRIVLDAVVEPWPNDINN